MAPLTQRINFLAAIRCGELHPVMLARTVATLDHKRVREERQNFDPAGHYARPDVTQLTVNRERQCTVIFTE